jgi:hypothetical protein
MASMFELQPFLSRIGLSNPGQPVTGANVAPGGGFQFQDPTKGMGFFDQMKYYQQNNPEVLLNFAAGMLKGDSGLAVHDASAAIGATRKEERDKQALAVQQNSTLDYLVSKGVSREEALAAVNDPMILKALLQETEEKRNPDFGAKAYGTPIWFINPTTNEMTIGALGKNGELLIEGNPLPPGWRPATQYEQAMGKAAGGGIGTDYAKVVAEYRSAKTDIPRVRQDMQKLAGYAKGASFTLFDNGWDNTLRQFKQTTEGAEAKAKFESLLKLTILPQLRILLGSQFTENDRLAMEATLGDVSKSPIEKLAAIDVYMDNAEAILESKARLISEYGTGAGMPTIDTTGGGGGGGGNPNDPAGLFD